MEYLPERRCFGHKVAVYKFAIRSLCLVIVVQVLYISFHLAITVAFGYSHKCHSDQHNVSENRPITFIMKYIMEHSSCKREISSDITRFSEPWKPNTAWTPEMFIEEYESWCEVRLAQELKPTEAVQSHCPCVPSSLNGKENVTQNIANLTSIQLNLLNVRPGGLWKPADCRARQSVAIIVPFRDRERHLEIFLMHIHSFLQRQKLEYTIYVVEQALPAIFNKASMMNIGFEMAKKQGRHECFIFHDVDMLPEDDRNFYICSDQPTAGGSLCDKFKYRLFYPKMFGGAIALSATQFENANGFSNEFYGWGGEDDDMYRRVIAANYSVFRNPHSVSRYTMLTHKRDKGNNRSKSNSRAHYGWKFRKDYYRIQGLNTLVYRVENCVRRPLYTWILASIPEKHCELLTKKAECTIPEYSTTAKLSTNSGVPNNDMNATNHSEQSIIQIMRNISEI